MKLEWKTCFKAGITVFLLYLGIYYWETISGTARMIFGAAGALFTGCVIAYLLNILMSFYERLFPLKNGSEKVKNIKRIGCLLASMLTFLAAAIFVICMVLPELAACIKLLIAEIPGAIADLFTWLERNGTFTVTQEMEKALLGINWQEKIMKAASTVIQGIGGMTQAAVSAVSVTVSAVTKFAIGVVFAVYLLLGKERLSGQVRLLLDHYANPERVKKIRYVAGVVNDSFHKFIVGQCIEAVILGALCSVGMTILRFPYAVMIGTLIGFTALIPVAGAYIGAGVGAFMIMTVSPLKAIGFLLFIVVLQQLEGNLIYPKVVGTSIGLPGIWVLAAVTVGGGIWGIRGMLLGVPLMAAVYQLIRHDLNKSSRRERQEQIPQQ